MWPSVGRRSTPSLADVGDPADEAHQIVVPREHEGVDHDAAFPARGGLRARFGHDERIEPECVLVDAPVGLVSADGLPSVIMMICRMSLLWRSRMRATGAALRACSCSRADPHTAELGERNLFGGIVEQHHLERISGAGS